jgi:tetratricopeptide (TPR) repeat protein
MTNCTGSPAEQWLESYLQGTLPEAEASKFEEHYFDCPVCLAQVEALQAIALKLASQPRTTHKTLISWPIRAGALGAIAALLVLGFFGYQARHKALQTTVAAGPVVAAPPSSPSLHPAPPSLASTTASKLADLTLPAFIAPNLRGESQDASFEAGMKDYAGGNCRGAITNLEQVPAESAAARAAEFYSGACQMHMGNLAEAAALLRKVADAGDSPQQEAALYELAQIALADNDLATAHKYLLHATSLRGDLEQKAREQDRRITVLIGQDSQATRKNQQAK